MARILLADDRGERRSMIQRALGELRHDVVAVSSVREAEDHRWEVAFDFERKPRLVILGIAFVHWACEHHAGVPRLAVLNGETLPRKLARAGVHVLREPITPEDLRKALELLGL